MGFAIETNETLSNFSFNNWWDVFDAQHLRHNVTWTLVLLLAYIFIFAIGLIGNLMVILVITKCPSMRTVTNLFILNLAVADLLVIVFSVPVTLYSNIFQRKY